MEEKNKIPLYSIENILAESSSNTEFDIFPFEYFAKDIQHLKLSHRHNFYALIFSIAGSGNHTIDFLKYEIVPQRVFLINYGQLHHWDYLKRVKGYVVLFTQDFYNLIYTGNNKIKSEKALFNNNPCVDLDDSEFKEWLNLLIAIEHEYYNKSSNYEKLFVF